jgi:hypothetical protein
MDEMVKAALKKWPNVPHCYGWLALDARGDWYMRDDRTQAAGPFPGVKGSRILHDKLREFIERNYGHDEAGAWYFQNGPQRVYVELEAAPWIWRLKGEAGAAAPSIDAASGPASIGGASSAPAIVSHTGARADYQSAWLDELGRLFLATDLGLGLVHTLDMEAASTAVEQGLWAPTETRFDALPARFDYRLKPAPG